MIKFLDLKKINSEFDADLKNVFNNFLNSGNYILGDQVLNFETDYADYCGTKFCIGVSSGLDALSLIFEAYKLLGILKEGDEVIVPANTYIASILSISNARLKPVFIEPDINSFNIDITKIEAALTSKTKAVLGVHLYGKLYNVSGLENLCNAHNLILIEDAAQAHGASFLDGRKAGNLSNAAAFSFYPTKNLGALGDAGAITTNDNDLAEIIKKLRNYGKKSTYMNEIKGHNCRLDELQAAILRVKLKYLDGQNQKRREIAKVYLDTIKNPDIILPNFQDINEHVFHLFVIRNENRNRLKEYLFKNGVETLIHYPIPIHRQKAYKEFNKLNLPLTDKVHNEVLSLPMHHKLEENEVTLIVDVLSNFK